MFTRLLHQLATVEREVASTFDTYGNEVTTLDEVATDVPCRIQENTGAEETDQRDSVTRAAVGFFGDEVVLSPFDRITVDGITWEVQGQPVERHNATGLHHYEVVLRVLQP